MDKEMMKGSIDILILSVINQGNSYGYAIMQSLRENSNDLYQMTQGTLYPALKRLEKKGYLTSYWGDAPETGMKRKYYSITDQGIKALTKKIKDWNQITLFIQRCGGEFA